jgi:DNA-binding NtrC family response regulator
MAKILIIDDEPKLGVLLAGTLEDAGHNCEADTNPVSAIEKIKNRRFDVILSDIKMEPVDGMAILQAAREHQAETPVVMMTAYGSTAGAVAAMKAGAADYLTKPLDLDEVTLLVGRLLERKRTQQRAEQLAEDFEKRVYDDFIGRSAGVKELFNFVNKVAKTDTTVLLLGESGTGKEILARAIHKKSRRAERPFIATNCASLSETLLESELFGHEKGSFTGAIKQKPGRFEVAEGGTLFLDEIGEISAGFQAKLLRALEEGEITRVGSTETIRTDVRVIAATNRDLPKLVAAGSFREDLFFRLSVFPIKVPPLRQRTDDIPLLVNHFLEKLGYAHGRLDPALLAKLENYSWPGNVRELRNVLERAMILSDGDPITENMLGFLPPSEKDNAAPTIAEGPAGLEDQERQMIEAALAQAGGNKSKAADILKITRRVLYTKLKKYGMM